MVAGSRPARKFAGPPRHDRVHHDTPPWNKEGNPPSGGRGLVRQNQLKVFLLL